MLTNFKIDNFKSLTDFSLPGDESSLGKFVCLIGLNGAGKSTVLQAVDFVSQLVIGDVSKWLSSRGWERSDLVGKGSKKRNINFSMHFLVEGIGDLTWVGSYNSQQGRCTKEELSFVPFPSLKDDGFFPTRSVVFNFESGVIRDNAGWRRDVGDYTGSVFNKFKAPSSGANRNDVVAIYLLRYVLRGVKSLELLSPQLMRRSSKGGGDVGVGGETLAAFVYGLSPQEKEQFFEKLLEFYPRLDSASSKSGKYGWKRFFISERYENSTELDARHVNDGLLRIAAIIAQTVAKTPPRYDDAKVNPQQRGYQFVLLDEIENGMNPEVVERVVKYLLEVRQQVFVTTHSPLILNYLADDVARKSVFLIYRRKDGSSGATRFFEIKDVADRLELMGPGEAFLDVGLERLGAKLSRS
ncbi:putative ATPase [Lysobacter enzymogenes]|uniref:AAA family ATPase n=1 Tax=Lysobacter enzymogenes TaxID=69 RepID=UPI00339890A9